MQYGLNPAKPLIERIGPPSAEALSSYRNAGHSEAQTHRLTQSEKARLDRALSKLPALHREILRHHLRSISFIDVSGGGGSGLTSRIDDGEFAIFDFTLRAGILEESLSEFLTNKEQMLFADEPSGGAVSINASGNALEYVLLHEASHIVDQALRLTSTLDPRFTTDVWIGSRDLAPVWAGSLLATTPFRRSPKNPISSAPDLYRSLATSPFISIYATAAAAEDFAELVAWQQLSIHSQRVLEIVVRDGSGKPIYRLKPIDRPIIRTRLLAVKDLLAACAVAGSAKGA
ncbi:hypothetical protein [Sphingobium sp. CR28]|uniref:hypothetical protein n=1 Tax=Sphingobium sp. CR28 TaxID=3400272 RepID=UPI003FEE6E47